ncbi:MAG TPA: PspA/IM30 family protein [Clostridiaceae bacterium]
MSVLSRVSNMFKAKVNTKLDEMENPIELLDQKIRDMEESLNTAKLSGAQVLGNVHEVEYKMKEAIAESKEFDEKVKLALSKGNEDLAKKALERKLNSDKSASSLQSSFEEASKKGQVIKKSLKDLEDEIQKTRTYRDEAAARLNNANATQKVNEILSNVNTYSNKINLDDIERKIEKKEAMAAGLGDLKINDPLEDEFEKLNTLDLDAELLKYKKAKVE